MLKASEDKPYIEILTPPGVKFSNVKATGGIEVRIVPMPVEEMCLEDMPTIEVDLGDLEESA